MSKKLSATEIVTGEVRFSYAHLFAPYAATQGADEKYSVCLLIRKDDARTLELIRQAIKAAEELGSSSKWNGRIPKNLHNPLRDGDADKDLEKNPEYEGCYFINCNSTRRPGIIDKKGREILDPEELKSGDYGKADVKFYAYSNSGNNGVACAINNVMKTRDGESLGSSGFSADAAFAGEFEDGDGDDDDLI